MGTFADELRELPEGLDEGWVVTCTGQVHCGFEFAGEFSVAQAVQRATDVGFDRVELALHLWVGGHSVTPFGAQGFIGGLWALRRFDHLPRVKVDEPLGLILGKPKFFEDGGGGLDGLWIDRVAVGGFEGCVCVGSFGIGLCFLGCGFG